MRFSPALAVGTALMLLAGCTGETAPADPVWGKQPCAHCHMLLSDRSTAAQLRTTSGGSIYFDDIGCLVEHVSDWGGAIGRRVWVRDARGTWRSALSARYAGGQRTPMGYGIVVQADGPLDFAQVRTEIAHKRSAWSER